MANLVEAAKEEWGRIEMDPALLATWTQFNRAGGFLPVAGDASHALVAAPPIKGAWVPLWGQSHDNPHAPIDLQALADSARAAAIPQHPQTATEVVNPPRRARATGHGWSHIIGCGCQEM